MRARVAVAALAAGFLAIACADEKAMQTPSARPPSILLVSIDTLRSDRLPVYGYAAGRTPALDRFRSESILYSSAFSPVPQTLPAHAAMFTGKMPWDLGLHDNIGYALSPGEATLASRLRALGMRTGGAVSAWVLRDETGIASGFEQWDDELDAGAIDTSIAQRSGERTLERAVNWIDSTGTQPFFAFVHFYEPHAPWDEDPAFEDPYDAEIARADRLVGRLFDHLRARGRWDDTVVIVVSDHGEGLGDHGEVEHGVLLYREALQVPLMIKLPGGRRAGETHEGLVSIADLNPTLLALAGAEATDPTRDLLDATPDASRLLRAQSHYGRIHMGWASLQSVISERHHLVQGRYDEMFDWKADPLESEDVRERERRAYARLRTEAESLARSAALTPPSSVSDEDRRRLESLGYLGSGVSVPDGELPDPRDRIGAIHQARLAIGALERGDPQRAASIARELTESEPSFSHAWGVLGKASRLLGRNDEALAALRRQLELSPSNAGVALALSEIYAERSEWTLAADHARLGLRGEKEGAETLLLRIAIASRNVSDLETLASEALGDDGAGVPRLLAAAQGFRLLQQPQRELAALDRAVAGSAKMVRDVQFRRGELLLAERRIPEAEAAFRAEVQTTPSHAPAWGNLVMLVAAQSRRDEALSLLAQAERSAPGAEMRAIARDARAILSSPGSR